jgi:hypothetical protein
MAQVTDPKWHDEGFFVQNYVTYRMNIPTLGHDVRRKDKDFCQFQEYLRKVYPHILIPGIPEFKKEKKNDPKFWERRAVHMQNFVNKVLQSEDLRGCPVVVDFIAHKDFKAFSKMIKGCLDKAIKPSTTGELF